MTLEIQSAKQQLIQMLQTVEAYVSSVSEKDLAQKPAPNKWSKKEIIGHLIDSGINNLQRFTEIQFTEKPYKVKKYNQDGLVKANDYQNAEISEILGIWLALNRRIIWIMEQQSAETLAYEVILPSGELSNLHFLMTDYVDHFKYHLEQIMR